MGEKIFHYINDPVINRLTAPENKLYRPAINFQRTAFVVLSVLCLNILISIVIEMCYVYFVLSDVRGTAYLALFPKIFLRVTFVALIVSLKYIFIWFIRIYQRYARSDTRLKCCFTPSCSDYAILAIKKYGVFIGAFKTVDRLLRCMPPGGIDYP